MRAKLWLATVYAAALVMAGCGDSADPDTGPCGDRTGGALITFDIAGTESMTVWATGHTFIGEALELEGTGSGRIPQFNDLVDGADCDEQWSWHVDPADMTWVDATIELCDGLPSAIETDKSYWLGTVDQYCPWTASVAEVALE